MCMSTTPITAKASATERLALILRIDRAFQISLKRIERAKRVAEQELNSDANARNH